MPVFIEKKFKTILIKRKFIDNWFWERYAVNPYNGCQFGCIYCDSRSMKYNLPVDFENNIIIKKDASVMLDKRITNARTFLPDIVGAGSACDPYQACEKKFRNTRKCLEIIQKHDYPVSIGTKSTLVLDDISLLDDIGRSTWACVGVTITTVNPDKAKFLEKFAPLPDDRFNVIKTLKTKAHNIQAGVWFIPIVPGFCDSGDDMEILVKKAKDNGADYIIFGSMTMRDAQAEWFLQHMSQSYPELIGLYEKLYKFNYKYSALNCSYTPDYIYSKKINLKMLELCDKYNISPRIKRFIPQDYRKYNYIIAENFLNESYILQVTGKPWSNLYWAGQNIQNLKKSIVEMTDAGELRNIRNINDSLKKRILNILKN